jgi:lysophospholipase L1-like esterase
MTVRRALYRSALAVACLGIAALTVDATTSTAGAHRATSADAAVTASAPAGTIDTWAASADDLGPAYTDKTVRDIVHASTDGTGPRVRLSNAFGTGAVRFDSVYLGEQASGANVVAGTNRRVTFGGRRAVTVPKGADVLSDPVATTVRAHTNLAISMHVDGPTGEVTGHHLAEQDNFYGDGDIAAQNSGAQYVNPIGSWFWLDAVTVSPSAPASTVVTLGDSITDGYQSTANANHRWPDYLADRLAAAGSPIGVANEGISGNEVTADGAGVSAQARLDRDVLSQAGAHTVIFLEGINDIGNGLVNDTKLIAGDRQIIARVHAAGLRILGATMTPFQGAGYYSSGKERVREAVNQWIRSSGEFDGVIDFDAVTRDPAHPKRFLPRYDSGDHLHPDDAGYAAMAAAVPLSELG